MPLVACIGSGNMGTALMKGVSNVIGGENIFFTDIDRKKAENSAKNIGGKVLASNIEAINLCDFVFLSVKPQTLEKVLIEIATVVSQRVNNNDHFALISIAAGWSIEKIQKILTKSLKTDKKVPVIRLMPNTPALIGEGVLAFSVSSEVFPEEIEKLEYILGACGIVDCIDERLIDAVSGLSGAGPAFVYIFIEALTDAGVKAGLSREMALRYAMQTVKGAALMLKETGKHPAELKDAVTSPGGATIAGITVLENGAFRGTVINAVTASCERSKELGNL